MSERYNPKAVAEATMATLKDFQKETVNRVIELYKSGRNRVLIADEVGLGKTVVARGVIARFAELREEEKDDLVKVAYICSNQSIARQNVQKLRVSELVNTDVDPNEARLSMQHLRIAEQENDPNVLNGYVQIIPLTPETSFRMTSGVGLRWERALIYVILEKMLEGSEVSLLKLRRRLYASVQGGYQEDKDEGWKAKLDEYRGRVSECEKISGGKYPGEFIGKLEERGVCEIAWRLSELDVGRSKDSNDCIRQLRQIFAEESAAMLNPDLVIMDEFQRFRFLINGEEDSETQILAKRFLKENHNDPNQKTRVLLLSATPYKLYSTAEEILETGNDDEYHEFLELLDFIFDEKKGTVRDVWGNYTKVLREHSAGLPAVMRSKEQAEEELSGGICRTERVSVMDDGDFISDSGAREPIDITSADVESYIEFTKMLRDVGVDIHLPIDYIKSCPYLMSYLRGYQIWDKIKKATEGSGNHRKVVARTQGRHLWIKKSVIENYRELPPENARLEVLKSHAFAGNADRYMWIPPTIPYYPLAGVYKSETAKDFSKVLVFSSWEMVPRMISTLISYEAERRTVGHKSDERENKRYDKKHSQRLRERPSGGVEGEKTAAYEALVEPEDIEWLVGLWNPIETLNAKLDLHSVEQLVRDKVREKKGRLSDEEEEILVNKALGSPAVCIARRIGLDDDKYKELAKIFWDRFNNVVGTAVVDRAYERRRDDASHWQNVLRYCKDGCFQAMFDEYYAVIRDDVSFLSEANQRGEIIKRMVEGLSLRTASYDIDCVRGAYTGTGKKERVADTISMRTHYAVGFAKGNGEEVKGIERKDALRKSFNSPMRPFVLASTSIGQEGLDFHPYCRKIFHWNLPSNPIDLEQREGRINRYKCFAVRKNVALKYGTRLYNADVWAEVYQAAKDGEKVDGLSDLVPFWCFGRNQEVKIDRIFPMYPCSRDEGAYNRLISVLSIYRLSMGQPRQEELLEHVVREWPDDDLKKLFLNLSPFRRRQLADKKLSGSV